jgi:hypothetical protein
VRAWSAAIESGSGSNVTDYVAYDGSNNIEITADVQDLDTLQAMLASPPPEMAAAMEAWFHHLSRLTSQPTSSPPLEVL